MWDDRYGQPGWAYGTEPNDFLRKHAGSIPEGEVLCLAEGQGRNAVYLAGLGYQVHAVDRSAVGLARAEELAAERGVTIAIEAADLATYDLGIARWAGIISISAHVPPAVRARLHRAVVEGLVAGGVFILEAYAPSQVGRGTGGPPDRELCYPLDAVREELSGLRFDHAVEREREVVEGRYHTGLAAVTQLIGVKPG